MKPKDLQTARRRARTASTSFGVVGQCSWQNTARASATACHACASARARVVPRTVAASAATPPLPLLYSTPAPPAAPAPALYVWSTMSSASDGEIHDMARGCDLRLPQQGERHTSGCHTRKTGG